MPVVALNHRAPKFGEPSAAMMFGILPVNRNAKVAKSHQELAVPGIVMKMSGQLALRASTATKHQVVRHAPVVMMHHQVVHHVHIKMKLQLAHHALAAMMQRQVARVVMMHQPAHLVNTTMRPLHEHHASVVTMHQQVVHHEHIKMKHLSAHLALSAKKFMHQSLVCHAKRFQLIA
jgi:hypothetical protein